MMGAFNVTELEDFGYPETTRFLDPMEERWRVKRYNSTDLDYIVNVTLPFYSSLDAYSHPIEINKALIGYHASGPER